MIFEMEIIIFARKEAMDTEKSDILPKTKVNLVVMTQQ